MHQGLGAIVVAALLFTACGTTPQTERQRLKELNQEISLGRGIAASLLGKFKLDAAQPAQTQYIATVGTYLSQQFGRPELEYKFAIVKEGPVNAYACPGGFIFLSRSLVDKLRSEDELITVLGHEIAHINFTHVYQKIKKPKDVSFGATLSRMMSQGGGDLSFALGEAVKAGMKLLTEEGLGTAFENEADEAALTYAQSIGVDGGALYRFLARTADSQAGLPKSHPPLQARLALLQTWLMTNTGTAPAVSKEPKARQERFKKRMALR